MFCILMHLLHALKSVHYIRLCRHSVCVISSIAIFLRFGFYIV